MTEMPKIVVHRLRKVVPGTHPDADLITAFVEKSLADHERDQILEHLAKCADCRETVVLAFPEQAIPIAAAATQRHVPRLSWPVLRWGALAACVAIVGVAVTLRHQFRASPPVPARPLETSQMEQDQLQAAIPSETKAIPAEKTSSLQPSETQQPAGAKKKVAPVDRESLKSLVAEPKPTPPAAPSPALSAQNKPNPAQTETVEVSGANETVAASSAAADEALPGRAKDLRRDTGASTSNMIVAGGPLAKQKAAAAGAVTMQPLPAAPLFPRWTLSTDGSLQRSFDSGRTWETIPVDPQASFRALAANGMEIWVGGTQGVLYHSSDAGAHWNRVQPLVNGEALSADIIGVQFTDAMHGTLTTAAKETWTTEDAGQSWTKK